MIDYDALAIALAETATGDERTYFAEQGIDYEALAKTATKLAGAELAQLDQLQRHGPLDRSDMGGAIIGAFLAGAQVVLRAKGRE